MLTPSADGGSTANLCILLLYLWGAAGGYEGSYVALKAAKRNQITVGLQLFG